MFALALAQLSTGVVIAPDFRDIARTHIGQKSGLPPRLLRLCQFRWPNTGNLFKPTMSSALRVYRAIALSRPSKLDAFLPSFTNTGAVGMGSTRQHLNTAVQGGC